MHAYIQGLSRLCMKLWPMPCRALIVTPVRAAKSTDPHSAEAAKQAQWMHTTAAHWARKAGVAPEPPAS